MWSALDEVWNSKDDTIIPIKDVHSKVPAESDRPLLASHLSTGCDTTSYFAGTLENHSVQNAHHNLINSLGDGTLTDDKVKSAERFICKLYKVPDSVDAADEKVCSFREGNQSWSLTTNQWCTKIPHFGSTLSGTDIEDSVYPKPHYTCTKSVWMEEGAEFYDTNFRVSECHPTRMFGTRVLSVSEGMSNNVLQVQKNKATRHRCL